MCVLGNSERHQCVGTLLRWLGSHGPNLLCGFTPAGPVLPQDRRLSGQLDEDTIKNR